MVHGGAGKVSEDSLPKHLAGCRRAAAAAGEVLLAGGTAVEAACAAVVVLEDDPVFNAGTGCALDREGRISLDAAVMDGATRAIGAVAALPAFRNPVRIAQLLLADPTAILAGEEAAGWAEAHGFERARPEDMIPEHARRTWERVVQAGGPSNWAGGTVGAVVRDAEGRLAGATSTGGAMGKLPGRVGDTPVPGAGFFADEAAAACATGQGEAFLRSAFCVRVVDAVRGGADPLEAVREHLLAIQRDFEGLGGAILMPCAGEPVAFCTTESMAHAWWTPDGAGSAA